MVKKIVAMIAGAVGLMVIGGQVRVIRKQDQVIDEQDKLIQESCDLARTINNDWANFCLDQFAQMRDMRDEDLKTYLAMEHDELKRAISENT